MKRLNWLGHRRLKSIRIFGYIVTKTHKFSLEPVLNHRKFLEDSLQTELAHYRRLMDDEKEKLWTFKKAKMRCLRELQRKREGNISVSEVMLYVSFIENMSNGLRKQKQRVFDAKKKLDQKREKLIKAMKKKKTLEKLKEKDWKEYRQGLMKAEQIFFDEVAANRFNQEM